MSVNIPEGQGNENPGNEGNQAPPPAEGQKNDQNSPGEVDYKAEAERLRGEIRKLRKVEDQIKALRPKAQKFDELQQAAMSAEERAALAVQTAEERAKDAENRAATANADLERYKVAAKHKLSEDDMKFLRGVPSDELEATAKDLAKRLRTADIPDFDGGSRENAPTSTEMGTFLRDKLLNARGRR